MEQTARHPRSDVTRLADRGSYIRRANYSDDKETISRFASVHRPLVFYLKWGIARRVKIDLQCSWTVDKKKKKREIKKELSTCSLLGNPVSYKANISDAAKLTLSYD